MADIRAPSAHWPHLELRNGPKAGELNHGYQQLVAMSSQGLALRLDYLPRAQLRQLKSKPLALKELGQ